MPGPGLLSRRRKRIAEISTGLTRRKRRRLLAHNLTIGFQLHSNLATAKPHSAKRTYSYWLVSMKTLRFTIINRAARVARIHGRRILRFSLNPATQVLYDQVLDRFAA